jgi:hypothetical protein
MKELLRLKLELRRAVDAQKWRRGGSKWSPGGSVDQWSQIRIPLITLSKIRTRNKVISRIRICIKVKRWIPIRIKVIRICNTANIPPSPPPSNLIS